MPTTLFIVNDATGLEPRQTTSMLLLAAARLGPTWVCGVQDLFYEPDGIPRAQARLVADTLEALSTAPRAAFSLADADLVMMRTNPARDAVHTASHRFALDIAQHARHLGCRVVNDPDGLARAATKRYLLDLPPSVRPLTYIAQDRASVVQAVAALDGPAVIKPVQGTRGSDVFFIRTSTDPNLNQIADVVLRTGPAMIQAMIPGAEAGDTRVVLLDGQVLHLGSTAVAIRRTPGPGELRSNVHAGGSASMGEVTPAMQTSIDAIGPHLVRDGLRLAGLDFIGSQVVEVNVFSTGGLYPAETTSGHPFARTIMERLLR